jgi:Tfp pilus assembly protein PilO
MKGADRNILFVVPVIVVLAAVWVLLVSPKQDQVKKLDTQISTLQSSVQQQRQTVQQGRQARKHFPRDYQRLVVTGKAVPTQDETASLLVQVNRIAGHSGISFESITQGGSDASSSGTSPTAAAPTTVSGGATPGPGGLTTLPYTLTFNGTFFQIADFIARLDRLVDPKKGTIAANGRLTTIDGFTLGADEKKPFPALLATVSLTTYLTPDAQAATAGADASGSAAPAAAGTAAPAAAPASSATPAPTSSSTTPASSTTAAPATP